VPIRLLTKAFHIQFHGISDHNVEPGVLTRIHQPSIQAKSFHRKAASCLPTRQTPEHFLSVRLRAQPNLKLFPHYSVVISDTDLDHGFVEIDSDEMRRFGHGFLPHLGWSFSITPCFSRGGFLYIIHRRFVLFLTRCGAFTVRPERSGAKSKATELALSLLFNFVAGAATFRANG
jgi:hypothetical protein